MPTIDLPIGTVDYRVFGLHRKEAVPFQHFALSVPSGRCDHPVL